MPFFVRSDPTDVTANGELYVGTGSGGATPPSTPTATYTPLDEAQSTALNAVVIAVRQDGRRPEEVVRIIPAPFAIYTEPDTRPELLITVLGETLPVFPGATLPSILRGVQQEIQVQVVGQPTWAVPLTLNWSGQIGKLVLYDFASTNGELTALTRFDTSGVYTAESNPVYKISGGAQSLAVVE